MSSTPSLSDAAEDTSVAASTALISDVDVSVSTATASAAAGASGGGGAGHDITRWRRSGLLWQVLGALAATFGGVSVGLTLGYTSSALPSLSGDTSWTPPLSASQASLIGAAVPLGALAGGLAGGWLAQRFGHRALMAGLALPLVCGWLLVAYATNVAAIVAGRVATGVVAGASSAIITGFVGETVTDRVRGALGASFQLMVTLGVLASYGAGSLLAWRWLALLGAAVAPLWAVAVALLGTDSPAWLVRRHRRVEAAAALRRLRGHSGSDCAAELARLCAQVEQQQLLVSSASTGGTWRRLALRRNRRPLLMSLMLMLLQQLSGVNVVIFYTKQIFQDAGVGLAPDLATILVGGVQVVATLAGVLLVDRAGRRLLLIVSDVVMSVCLLGLGVFFQLKSSAAAAAAASAAAAAAGASVDGAVVSAAAAAGSGSHAVDSLGWLPLVSLLLFISAFSVGFGPIPWLMVGELFAPDVQGSASGLATAFNWLLAFLVTLLFEPLSGALGLAGTFWLFSGACLLGAVYVWRCVLETRNRTLQQICEHFQQ